ncbi:hypothetical protein CPB83DRAFT_843412 [Crepidotus variabilis]|uniref:tRNA-specific adenosine deaminase 1 n=1 Tax=Crepidotus variabilis TaxID=179855 RepID=A0A9P6ETF5_9AGAR|nr:hypothetical protein CPB83DRAFT_843412 [Crepidotus variabilis]
MPSITPLTTVDENGFFKTAVKTIQNIYQELGYKPQAEGWTILASFFLSRQPNIDAGTSGEVKVISLATGTKCLKASRNIQGGELIHDSHAEVLARRSALRWFFEEIQRVQSGKEFKSAWIDESEDQKFKLHEDVELNLYVSTVPCGDASMRLIASTQEEQMATLKNASAIPTTEIDTNETSRGRDNYARLGALRTKPGRADSPPTFCMSCSDKIARWNVLGIQGAIGSLLLDPLYLSTVVVGEVPEDLRETVKEDCERAFRKRIGDIEGLPKGYSVHHPKVVFTDVSFKHSRSASESTPNACNEGKHLVQRTDNTLLRKLSNPAIFWLSESEVASHQVVINGLKRGVAPKHRFRDKSRPLICRLSMAQLLIQLKKPEFTKGVHQPTYQELKDLAKDYQTARMSLLGPNGPFAGWVLSNAEWQTFAILGYQPNKDEEPEAPAETAQN